jgi:hypothetical protein
MKVDGYQLSAFQIDACFERMKTAPFTREELIDTAAKAGVPKAIKCVRRPADRLALRLIQQQRARGTIEQYERRRWRWKGNADNPAAPSQISQLAGGS